MQNNVIKFAKDSNVQKFVFVSSGCVYPKDAKMPIKEEAILSNYLPQEHKTYALAKIIGIELGNAYYKESGFNFVSSVPVNIYGPNDDFSLQFSHFVPALVRKFYEAVKNNLKEIEIWGSGNQYREIIYANDLARALILLMEKSEAGQIYNTGSDYEMQIKDIVNLLIKITGFNGKIVYNVNKPEGIFRKKIDNTKIFNLGFKPKYSPEEGLRKTFEWLSENYENARK